MDKHFDTCPVQNDTDTIELKYFKQCYKNQFKTIYTLDTET